MACRPVPFLSILLALVAAAPPATAASAAPPTPAPVARTGPIAAAPGGEAVLLRGTGRLRLAGPASEGGPFRLRGSLRSPTDVLFADDFESGDLSAWAPPAGMPSGTVAFFDRATCPSGWLPLETARGRTVKGVPAGGTTGATVFAPLADLVGPTHAHHYASPVPVTSQPGHAHPWSYIGLYAANEWTSYSANNGVIPVFSWDNGIDNAGSGTYPFSASSPNWFWTAYGPSHGHPAPNLDHWTEPTSAGAFLPYVQLLVCRKS